MNSVQAKSTWVPSEKEKKAFLAHNYVKEIDRVDDIWPWLNVHCGNVLAVHAPHSLNPESYTYKELSNQISKAAAAFQSLGVQDGDVIALFAENSPRWLIADQGLMRLGAANAVRGASAPLEELRYILNDSSSVGLIVQTAELWNDLALTDNEKNKLKFVLQIEGAGAPQSDVIAWEEFVIRGEKEKPINSYNQLARKTSERSIASVLYTSGTTGKPKGVPLSHNNFLHQIRSLACIASPTPGTPLLSILPIWHSYERSAEYYFFSCGCSQHYSSIKHFKQDLQDVRPVVMATVPRLWEAVKTGFDDALKKMPLSRQTLLRTALANSRAFKSSLRKSRNLLLLKVNAYQRLIAFIEVVFRLPLHICATLILWPKVLKQLSGGKLRFPINGGGAIAPHIDEFFESLGVEMLVGYGLTETSPVLTCRRTWKNIRGSSGSPLPGTEIKIVHLDTHEQLNFLEKGRVLARGPQVMEGYLGKPEETAKVLDEKGWFDTGDLGMLLEDGSLVLTGRAKDTIVLSSGENIEPGPLEEALLASPLINQLILVGQDERSLASLIVPNFDEIFLLEEIRNFSLEKSLDSLNGNTNFKQFLRKQINQLLADRKGSRMEERVIGLAFVQPFSIENGLLTQTLKQRRNKISERDSQFIEEIYGR